MKPKELEDDCGYATDGVVIPGRRIRLVMICWL